MEFNSSENLEKSPSSVEKRSDLLIVRAIISCPICNYRKIFRNQFLRQDIELMVVALKVFDWMVCNSCGELLNLDLEFFI
ncbi:MAG: hypothetical protein ACTSQJ_12340 [Promethearchaeota archaeon]